MKKVKKAFYLKPGRLFLLVCILPLALMMVAAQSPHPVGTAELVASRQSETSSVGSDEMEDGESSSSTAVTFASGHTEDRTEAPSKPTESPTEAITETSTEVPTEVITEEPTEDDNPEYESQPPTEDEEANTISNEYLQNELQEALTVLVAMQESLDYTIKNLEDIKGQTDVISQAVLKLQRVSSSPSHFAIGIIPVINVIMSGILLFLIIMTHRAIDRLKKLQFDHTVEQKMSLDNLLAEKTAFIAEMKKILQEQHSKSSRQQTGNHSKQEVLTRTTQFSADSWMQRKSKICEITEEINRSLQKEWDEKKYLYDEIKHWNPEVITLWRSDQDILEIAPSQVSKNFVGIEENGILYVYPNKIKLKREEYNKLGYGDVFSRLTDKSGTPLIIKGIKSPAQFQQTGQGYRLIKAGCLSYSFE